MRSKVIPSRADHELRPFGIWVVLVEPAYTRTLFEDNLTTPDRFLDVYDLARAGAKAVMREAMQQVGDVPEVVAETVLKAATVAVPRRRYAAGKKARQTSFLRRFVPEAAFDKSLRKQMRLPDRRAEMEVVKRGPPGCGYDRAIPGRF